MIAFISSRDRTAGRLRSLFIAGTVSSSQTVFSTFLYIELHCRPIVIVSFRRPSFQTFGCKKTFRIFKRKIRNVFSNPTKEVTDIRAIQLNSSFTQVTFFRFIADRFKNIFIHNKTSKISSVNNYIYLFGGALAS